MSKISWFVIGENQLFSCAFDIGKIICTASFYYRWLVNYSVLWTYLQQAPSAQIACFLAIAYNVRVSFAVFLPMPTARILILASYNENKQTFAVVVKKVEIKPRQLQIGKRRKPCSFRFSTNYLSVQAAHYRNNEFVTNLFKHRWI